MKFIKSTTLILCLLLSFSIAEANGNSATGSISATATVIPVLGVMPTIEKSQSLVVSEASDSKLVIQAPKNSSLMIHISNAQIQPISLYLSQPDSKLSQKNSVADFITVDLLKYKTQNQSQTIITIITADN